MVLFSTLVNLMLITLITLISSISGQKSVGDSPLTRDSCYCLSSVIDHTNNPTSAVFFLDGRKERILVIEQRGVVSRYDIDGTRIDTFLDIRDRLVIPNDYGDSRGLLSLILDPLFDVNRNVYAYYIREDDGKEYAYVSMFSAQTGAVDPTSEKFLLRIYQPSSTGNGGPMLFGDDGYLYIWTGDGGEMDDKEGRAQNLNNFQGKVLRLDVKKQGFTDGESGIAMMYAIPKNNPFVNVSNAKGEVFALGIRNMWGCSQDSQMKNDGTGRIFCAETGTNITDEINIIESGKNYGWNLKEGTECRNVSYCEILENESHPIYEFRHNETHALVGGLVYRGKQFSHVLGVGNYIFGDVITGETFDGCRKSIDSIDQLWECPDFSDTRKTYFLEETSDAKWSSHEWGACESKKCALNARESRLKHILAFGQDLKGELYFLMTNELVPESNTARVLKLVPPISVTVAMTPSSALIIGCLTLMIILKNWKI